MTGQLGKSFADNQDLGEFPTQPVCPEREGSAPVLGMTMKGAVSPFISDNGMEEIIDLQGKIDFLIIK